jgi:hypothetical protein
LETDVLELNGAVSAANGLNSRPEDEELLEDEELPVEVLLVHVTEARGVETGSAGAKPGTEWLEDKWLAREWLADRLEVGRLILLEKNAGTNLRGEVVLDGSEEVDNMLERGELVEEAPSVDRAVDEREEESNLDDTEEFVTLKGGEVVMDPLLEKASASVAPSKPRICTEYFPSVAITALTKQLAAQDVYMLMIAIFETIGV